MNISVIKDSENKAIPKLTGLYRFQKTYGLVGFQATHFNEQEESYGFISKEKIREHLQKDKLTHKLQNDFSKREPVSVYQVREVYSSFEQIFSFLISHQPEHIGVEYTNEHTLYIFAKISNLDIHLETDFEDGVLCTLSVFKSDEIEFNFGGTIENCLQRLKKTLGKSTFSIESHSTPFYTIEL
ncbi:MAG: hypothetical protein EA362_02990 [Saprospirales bacterium]|nr:MAG: hypothetical protein EA362_02990 [Saprospirales bacterium]